MKRGGGDYKAALASPEHNVGMRVPHGGSSCAKCKYVSEDGKRCGEKNFQDWNGGDELPAPATDYCCDFYTIAGDKTLGDQLRTQRAKK